MTRHNTLGTLLGLFAASILAFDAGAQERPDNPLDRVAKAISDLTNATRAPTGADTVREATIDLAVPKSPAFTVLGLTPQSVIRPTSPQALGASLLSGADPRGNIQTGLALELAPYLLYGGNNITLRDYNDSYMIRVASRTQLSLATTKGTSDDDEATRVAIGLYVTPYDRGDPRTDALLLKCFEERVGEVHREAVKKQNEIAPLVARGDPDWPVLLQKDLNQLEQRAKERAQACREEARVRNWNASAVSLGLAPTWTAASGNVGDLKWSGIGIWGSAGYGFEQVPGLKENAQVLFHARYRDKELVPDPDATGKFVEQDTLTLAGMLRLAGPNFRSIKGGPDLNFRLEGAYVREARHGRPDENVFRYTGGAELRITENLYFDVTVGSESGRQQGSNNVFGMGNLKWGFTDKPKLNAP